MFGSSALLTEAQQLSFGPRGTEADLSLCSGKSRIALRLLLPLLPWLTTVWRRLCLFGSSASELKERRWGGWWWDGLHLSGWMMMAKGGWSTLIKMEGHIVLHVHAKLILCLKMLWSGEDVYLICCSACMRSRTGLVELTVKESHMTHSKQCDWLNAL